MAVTTTQCTGCINAPGFSTTSRSTDFKNKHTDPLARIAEEAGYQYEGLANVLAQLGKGAAVDVNKPLEDTNSHTTPLHAAAQLGNKSIMEKLLAQPGAKLDIKNDSGETPLYLAVQNKHKETIEVLIEKGANVNEKDQYNNSILQQAIENEDVETVKLLIENGVDIVSKPGKYKKHPLLKAAATGNPAIIQALLDKGKSSNLIEQRDEDQYSAAHQAAKNGKLEALKIILKEAPHLVDARTNYEDTPFQLAAQAGKEKVVEWFLQNYPNSIECVDHFKNTPLHDAAEHGYIEIAGQLLKAKPGLINITNTRGETALHKAVQEQNFKMVEHLLKHGAATSMNIRARSWQQEGTPLELAQRSHNKAIIDLLNQYASGSGL